MNRKVFNRLFNNRSKTSFYAFHPNDKLIDVCVRKFKVQQEDMNNLQKCYEDFIYQVQNLTITIENMYACFKAIYEPDWMGNFDFHQSCQQSMKIWRNFIDEVKTNIQMEFEKYGDKFPQIQRTIDKSTKKELEYQKCKSAYETCRKSRKIDTSKVKKAELEMKNAERQFNEINEVLKSDLPQFCDSRVQIYIQNLSLLFAAENKLFQSLQEERQNQLHILMALNETNNTGKYSIMNQIGPDTNYTNNIYDKMKASSVLNLASSDKHSLETNMKKGSSVWNISSPNPVYEEVSGADRDDSTLNRAYSYHIGSRTSGEDLNSRDNVDFPSEKKSTLKKKFSFNSQSSPTRQQSSNSSDIRPPPAVRSSDNSDVELQDDSYIYSQIRHSHKSQTSTVSQSHDSIQSDQRKSGSKKVSIARDSPPTSQIVPEQQFYYQVVAKYNYNSQDEDELTLRREDVIMVLPWESEDQQEVGWLFGENIKTKEKGLFPENHTSLVE